ncbi:DUF5666 domain-containing protein [Candidatus Albibeggiatoa sp. nov. BB20]|uniref:DUF5666 domain-containing protein n=1 Tax=Candidatus Albibeggiatoa sp. nov. BB20 TaxID=3162723 RepID=UPI0033659FE4
MNKNVVRFVWIFLALHLSACGEGGLSDLADGGIDGTGLGIGPISDFGSIIVNDIKYDIDQAQVTINGDSSHSEQLKLGMYVTVKGTQDEQSKTGTAQGVEYRDTLHGKLDFISLEGQTFRMLGQTVRLTEDTYRYGFSQLSDLSIGDILRVSSPALSFSGETITANLVERLPNATETSTLIGSVFNLDNVTKTFFISGLQINFAEIANLELQEGMTVQVTGNNPTRQLFQASQIQAITPISLAANTVVRIVGNVTRFEGIQDFAVQYRNMRISENLAQEIPQEGLSLGSRVRIFGHTDNKGIVDVKEIHAFENAGLSGTPNDLLLRASGALYAVDLNANTINVSGVQAQLSPRTIYQDISGAKPSYQATDLRISDYITIAGKPTSTGAFEVFQLHYEPFVPELQRQYQGLSSEIDTLNQQLYVLGKPVLTIASTIYIDVSHIKDLKLPPSGIILVPPEGNEVAAAGFFQRVEAKSNYLVNVTGDEQNDIVVAKVLMLLPFTLD